MDVLIPRAKLYLKSLEMPDRDIYVMNLVYTNKKL